MRDLCVPVIWPVIRAYELIERGVIKNSVVQVTGKMLGQSGFAVEPQISLTAASHRMTFKFSLRKFLSI